jgi:hypothetical protein
MTIRKRPGYIKGILIGIDQDVNALLYPVLNPLFKTDRFGYPDETLSSVFGKELRDGNHRVKSMCRFLHFFDKGHCENSIEDDEGK